MELYEATRSNPSCRYFTDDPVDPAVLHRIFDPARFADSGGNRQGWRTIVVTDAATKKQLARLHKRQWDLHLIQARDGGVRHQSTAIQDE